MFSDLFKIDAMKRAYERLTQELDKLNNLDMLTDSNIEKRKAIPKLEAEQAKIKVEFEDTIKSVKDWCATLPPEEKEYSELVLLHYCDITKSQCYAEFLKTIHQVNPLLIPSNVKAKIIKMWLNSFK